MGPSGDVNYGYSGVHNDSYGRPPVTGNDVWVYCILSSGAIYNYASDNFNVYDNSYGLYSPDTRRQYDMLIFDVYTDGEVRQNNGTYSYSYGLLSPNTDGDGWVCCVHSSGFVGDGHNHVNYNSYGRIQSPWTSGIRNAYYVRPAGDVNSGSTNGVDYSYGKLTSLSGHVWYNILRICN